MTAATMPPRKSARPNDVEGAKPVREATPEAGTAGSSKSAPKSLSEIARPKPSFLLDAAGGLVPVAKGATANAAPEKVAAEAASAKAGAEESVAKDEAAKAATAVPQRRDARVWALQLAYARSISDEPMDWLDRHLRGTAMAEEAELETAGLLVVPQGGNADFALSLARAATDGAERFDTILSGALKNWRVERLTLVDRLVLRLALAELESFGETPFRVVLNEYIELAKIFGTPQSAKFVNGVLDAAARVVRPIDAKGATPSATAKKKAAKKKSEPAG